jgi:hypothetical protein
MMKFMSSISGKWLTAGLLAVSSLALQAQDQPLQYISNKLTGYRNKTLQEKLFVHTDKKTYLAGEYVWFRVYYVEGYTHHPLQLSRLAYLEILNADNQPVVQAKVSLKPGEDNGALHLPLNLPTGNYRLRAYTNWMKNFSPDFYFDKQISIVNPLSNAREQSKAPVEPANEVEFFPEGGYLVRDLPSTLAFKAHDIYGRGLDFKGWILNERNDTLTSFSPLKFGMGSVPFTPAGGHTYKAAILFADGKRAEKELPQPLEQGYVMHLQAAGAGPVRIEVRTQAGNNAGTVYLIGHTREVVRIAEQATFQNGVAVFTVDAGRLDPGITQFTVFDANRQPVAERLYFTRPQATWKTEIQTDKKEYASREKISLSLRTLDQKGAPAPASLSLSVFRIDPVQVPDDVNIENYLLLTSDLAGTVEAPDYYFGEPTAERVQATDNLMLTQGWRRFRWQQVLNEKETFTASYPPEVNGPLVTARVYDARTGQPVSGLHTYLSLTGKNYQVYFDQSNSSGQVQYELKDSYGPGEMIIRPFSEDDSLYRIEVQNPYSEQYASTPLVPLTLSDNEEKLLENYSIGMQVRQVYAGDSLNHLTAPQPADTFPFLGVADYTYNLDDYTRFTTMEEVLREYVRPINVGVRKGKPHMLLFNETYHNTYDNNILVMLDGVPIYEPDRLFAYDPLKVKKLEVFPRAFVLGPDYFVGVANFTTYKGNFDAFELDPHLIALNFQGLEMQREFYAPTYDTPGKKASRLPDYRNTLYWNPDIHTAASGPTPLSFYSCDQKGRYLGLLQGMDDSGHTVVGQFGFEVR